NNDGEETISVLEKLRGQTLAQVGIDMLQDGKPVWMPKWESFLDSVAMDVGAGTMEDDSRDLDTVDGDATPTSKPPEKTAMHHPSPNVLVDVVVSRKDLNRTA